MMLCYSSIECSSVPFKLQYKEAILTHHKGLFINHVILFWTPLPVSGHRILMNSKGQNHNSGEMNALSPNDNLVDMNTS